MEATDYEICANCGDGVQILDPITGWCLKCSGKQQCKNCDRVFVPDQTSRILCRVCRSDNAEDIERRMNEQGISAVEAILQIFDDRPRCANCGDTISNGRRRGTRPTKFCMKKDCQRAQVRYRNYRFRNGMTDDKALERAVNGNRTEEQA